MTTATLALLDGFDLTFYVDCHSRVLPVYGRVLMMNDEKFEYDEDYVNGDG